MIGHNGGPPLDDPDEFNLNDLHAALAALERQRKDQLMLLVELEDVSGVSTNSFLAWRGGRRDPTLGCFVAIAQTIGFDVLLVRRSADSGSDCGIFPAVSKTGRLQSAPKNRGVW